MGLGEVKGLLIQSGIDFTTLQPVSKNGYWNSDSHAGGAWTGLIINSFIFTSLSACLYELIAQLKAKNIFDESVIQLSSDFGRGPGSNGGTGHESRNSTTTLISGAIKKPMVLGNCYHAYKDAFGNSWGSWGLAAPVAIDGANTTLGIGHISSTISHLLRVERINPNNNSLVLETTNGIVGNVELAKNK
ncbi:MAG: hypothetical protein AABY64_07015 [Bdellovibrionota bacterium]